MKQVITALSLVVVGCGSSSSTDSSPSAISDSVSIIKDGDNRYSVVCKDGSRESVTEADILTNNICPFRDLESEDGLIVPGGDLSISTTSNERDSKTIEIGKESWFKNSLISFKIKNEVPAKLGNVKVSDSRGKTWIYSKGSTVSFHHLAGPVTVQVSKTEYSSYHNIKASISDLKFKIIDTKSITMNSNKALDQKKIHTIGGTTTGIQISFLANINIFSNYESEKECTNITFKSSSGSVKVNNSERAKSINLRAPIEVLIDPLCISSRKPIPENDKKDFDLILSNFQVHKPSSN